MRRVALFRPRFKTDEKYSAIKEYQILSSTPTSVREGLVLKVFFVPATGQPLTKDFNKKHCFSRASDIT